MLDALRPRSNRLAEMDHGRDGLGEPGVDVGRCGDDRGAERGFGDGRLHHLPAEDVGPDLPPASMALPPPVIRIAPSTGAPSAATVS